MAASAWQHLCLTHDCIWPMRRKGYSYYSDWPFKSGNELSAYHITIYDIKRPFTQYTIANNILLGSIRPIF